VNAWILAARPKTLPAAAVPVWVGALPAFASGAGSWILLGATLSSCLCIQMATNLFNDAIDHRKGADTPRRAGPVRATASGLLSPRAVMAGAVGLCAAAVLFALPLLVARGWPVAVIGVVSLYFSYGYTGGPFPLAYRGMGELFVIVFFGFVAVCGSHFVQTGAWGGIPVAASALQCGLYSCALLAINNLRDRIEDAGSGKRTLAVRFGECFARCEIAACCAVPLALWPLAAPGAALLSALAPAAAGAAIVTGIVRNPPGPVFNRLLGLAALQLAAYAAAITWALRPW
jgi:1,4-dihydroxy-2-naphthoate polyprenyltransferase